MNAMDGPVTGERRERLRARLQALGFDEVGFAHADNAPAAGLRDWLGGERHADMRWMERTAEKRTHPALVLPGVKTIIVLGVNYWPGAEAEARRQSATLPRWARYALYEDYHETMKAGLVSAGRALEAELGCGADDYRYYVDTGPVLERGWAARAGIGFRGKNGMLISRRHGNWLFLAAILLRAEIAADAPLRAGLPRADGEEPAGLFCGNCTRCMTACPTAAIPSPGIVDARRCISYQTIENKGVIPRALRAAIGTRLYGCDICLEVCPWNRFAAAGRRMLLAAREEIAGMTLADLLALTPEGFAATFRRTAIKRLKLAGLLRNACVVAGNTGDAASLPALVRLAEHDSPLVRAHAVWAVFRIARRHEAGELLAAARAREGDATVLAEYAAETTAVP